MVIQVLQIEFQLQLKLIQSQSVLVVPQDLRQLFQRVVEDLIQFFQQLHQQVVVRVW